MNSSGSFSGEDTCQGAEVTYPSMLSHHHLSGLPSGSKPSLQQPVIDNINNTFNYKDA
jgi:hypothetical protein